MARGKEKPLLKAKLPRAKAKGKAKARPSVADSESYVHFRTADWSSLDTEVKVEKITGHCLVASGHRIWCIGGDREVEGKSPAKISLLMMDLRYRRWEDHTPPAASYAPSWRWGHSSCMLPTKFPVRPQHKQRKVMLMPGIANVSRIICFSYAFMIFFRWLMVLMHHSGGIYWEYMMYGAIRPIQGCVVALTAR